MTRQMMDPTNLNLFFIHVYFLFCKIREVFGEKFLYFSYIIPIFSLYEYFLFISPSFLTDLLYFYG